VCVHRSIYRRLRFVESKFCLKTIVIRKELFASCKKMSIFLSHHHDVKIYEGLKVELHEFLILTLVAL